jgi:Dyp-type peroxidase family
MTSSLPVDDIQGNLLLGYKFQHVVHLFGQVQSTNVNEWLGFFQQILPHVTRATKWKEKPKATLNIGFSYQGIEALLPVTAGQLATQFPAFAQGMPRRAAALGDGEAFQDDEWERRHVWISVHAQTPQDLDAQLALVKGLLGRLLLNELPAGAALVVNDHWHEHFGFRDDISYPAVAGIPGLEPGDLPGHGKFEGNEWRAIATGELILGHANESGANVIAGLSDGAQQLTRNGTFGVFRHLQQHVARFRQYVEQKSRPGATREYLASRMIGRELDGTPLVPTEPNAQPGPKNEPNQSHFRYDQDSSGAKCPLGAHVRRANPRQNGRHRLIRRGLSYGQPLAEGAGEDADKDERGLWFVAFNASIEDQFEFIQKVWLNSSSFGTLSDARDPIASTNAARAFSIEGDHAAGRKPIVLLDIPDFVTCHGGQYYLYPGLGGLTFLLSQAALEAPAQLRALS